MESKNTTLKKRNEILQAARILFYEKGYKDTFLEHIADMCGVTKPLISYHFKSKAALAREVNEVCTMENKNTISFKLYRHFGKDYDLQVSTAVEIRLTEMASMMDARAFRFIRERANDRFDDLFAWDASRLYKIHDRRYKLKIDRKKDEIAMMATSALAAGLALKFAFMQGEYACSMEDLLDYSTALHFRLMHIDEDRIADIIEQSKQIIHEVGFEIEPYFRIV